jgi:hypothetical protein
MNAKRLLTLCLVFALLAICGCTSVRTTEVSSDRHRDQITSGELIRIGERVTITTADGMNYELSVTQITEDKVFGERTIVRAGAEDESTLDVVQVTETENIEIPVVEIVAIDNREVTPIGAAGAIVGVGAFDYVLYFLVPALIVGALVGM